MPTIQWKTGTAFDFFVSLAVLHQPAFFGLRPSWAAGVRQRLSVANREMLEKVQSFSSIPLLWLSGLSLPYDASTALEAISMLPAQERLFNLTLNAEIKTEVFNCLQNIASRGSWQDADLSVLKEHFRLRDGPLNQESLTNLVTTWSEPVRSGEKYFLALQEYYQVFFIEEETRIRPALLAGLEHGKELASRMSLTSMIEELSQGVRFTPLDDTHEYILAPSYWSSPFIFYSRIQPEKMMLLFGARPEFESIVPGTAPPPQLVSALKALADPTRLRILHFLAEQAISSSELARLLRLRLPTVIHHLRLLRLAGLVQITVGETEKRYAARLEILDGIQTTLTNFIKSEQ
ncbi:MAG: ArsR family transcriptional regulator [Chloroflexota bacterium]